LKYIIWLIGGTSDAREIAQNLKNCNLDFIATSTTEYGASLMSQHTPNSLLRMLSHEEMQSFIESNNITLIIDASHPFAKDVSLNAIEASSEKNCRYIRFERETKKIDSARYFSSYENIVSYLNQNDGNILLTTGSKNLDKFTSLPQERLFARILSSSQSFLEAEACGFSAKQLIGMQGAGSSSFISALIKEYKISFLISKDSGEAGGINAKAEAATETHAELLILQKPQIEYPESYSSALAIISAINN